MIFFDTETAGLHGPVILIQYAEDNGDVQLYCPWTNTVQKTLDLFKWIIEHPGGIVGFNLAFDWFHICQMYTTLLLMPDKEAILEDVTEIYAEMEPLGRDGPCIKPTKACDVMLHARKGPYQSTMDRGDIRVKKVPTPLAWQLAEELEKRIKLKEIYFARRKTKNLPQWQVYDIEDEDGDINPDFKDVVLKFAPTTALKALAVDALGIKDEDIILYGDFDEGLPYPVEIGYAPFARAIGDRHNWKGAWPDVIRHWIQHWGYHSLARKYAANDVIYTRDLYKFFGTPELGDDDSELACMIASVRWRGFKVDLDKIKELKEKTLANKTKVVCKFCFKEEHSPYESHTYEPHEFEIPTSPDKARYYVTEFMDDTEKLIVKDSTKKVLLQEITKWKKDCPDCKGTGITNIKKLTALNAGGPPFIEVGPDIVCTNCKGTKLIVHPAAIRATEVLDARLANYEADLYDKFLLAGRFHASFNVIGALSSRMSGTDGLNAQGIKNTKEVRRAFTLAWDELQLDAGDFSGFEVTLAEACYNDADLRKDLLSGKKIHALFGVFVFPDMTYEEILATDGQKVNIYDKCKKAVFAMFYGGEGYTLKDRLGVDQETADKAYEAFCRRYPKVGIARRKVSEMFQGMKQPGGIGSNVEWHEPAEYIDSMFGFRRYFTLENQICKALYHLATKPPKEWKDIKIKVNRRDRLQTASGAVQSALFAAAFQLQANNMRAALNHVIQSSGATITKKTQRAIWDIQPPGINKWYVQPMNVHDEVQCPCLPEVSSQVKKAVDETVESIRPKVPLIKMDWKQKLNSWADKS